MKRVISILLLAATISDFSDADEISEYAADSFGWAFENGIVKGTSDSTLSPKNAASRAQVAAILMRYCEMEITK